MATIENFLLRFKVDGQGAIDRASASIQSLGEQAAQFGAATGPVSAGIANITSRLGPLGIAAGAAVTAFAALGNRAVQLAAEISDIAGATGIAEGTLLNFRTSVIEAGGKAEDFGQIAAKLNQNVQEAASGNEKLQESFRRLGVFVTDSAGNIRSTEAILRDITQRFQEGSLSGERYSAAVDILGRNITKLDLQKLSAIADPIKDEQIKKLDQYAEAIDRIRDKFERTIITFFGAAAQQAEAAFNKMDERARRMAEEERQLNLRGLSRMPQPGTSVGPLYTPQGGFGTRRMLPQEIQEFQRRQFEEDMARLMAPAAGAPRGRTELERAGGFGAADPERLKREAEQRRREQERLAEKLARELQTVRDMASSYEKISDSNVTRLYLQEKLIRATEYDKRLTEGRFQIETRYADQIAALEAKKETASQETVRQIDASIAQLEIRRKIELDAFNVLQQKLFLYEQEAKEIERITGEIDKQRQIQLQIADIVRGITDQQRELTFERSLRGLSPLQREIAKINEQARKSAAEAGRGFSQMFAEDEGGMSPERAQEFADGLKQIGDGYRSIADQQIQMLGPQDEFMNGLMRSFKTYRDEAMDTAGMVRTVFETATRGMEDAIVKFAMTGKLSFRDMAQSIIADIIRIQVRRAIVSAASIFGFANGGPVQAGKPIIVGERGPEMFLPRQDGTIVSNHDLKSASRESGGGVMNVTYNISAVDAQSFRSLVARDPEFIFRVTEAGRRSQPSRRLA